MRDVLRPFSWDPRRQPALTGLHDVLGCWCDVSGCEVGGLPFSGVSVSRGVSFPEPVGAPPRGGQLCGGVSPALVPRVPPLVGPTHQDVNESGPH